MSDLKVTYKSKRKGIKLSKAATADDYKEESAGGIYFTFLQCNSKWLSNKREAV